MRIRGARLRRNGSQVCGTSGAASLLERYERAPVASRGEVLRVSSMTTLATCRTRSPCLRPARRDVSALVETGTSPTRSRKQALRSSRAEDYRTAMIQCGKTNFRWCKIPLWITRSFAPSSHIRRRWLGQKPLVGSDTLFLVDGARHAVTAARNPNDRPSRCEFEQPEAGNLFATNRRRTIQVSRLASEQIGRRRSDLFGYCADPLHHSATESGCP